MKFARSTSFNEFTFHQRPFTNTSYYMLCKKNNIGTVKLILINIVHSNELYGI